MVVNDAKLKEKKYLAGSPFLGPDFLYSLELLLQRSGSFTSFSTILPGGGIIKCFIIRYICQNSVLRSLVYYIVVPF